MTPSRYDSLPLTDRHFRAGKVVPEDTALLQSAVESNGRRVHHHILGDLS